MFGIDFANFLVFLAVAGGFWLIHRIVTALHPPHAAPAGGRIRPSRLWVALLLLSGLFLLDAFGYFILKTGNDSVALGGLIASILLTLLSLLPLHDACEIRWDGDGIEGPGRRLFLPGHSARVRLGWDLIGRVGDSGWPWHYLEGPDGSRIYWSRFHAGHGAFEALIRKRRPDLFAEMLQV